MHRIGSELIEERLKHITPSSVREGSSQTDGRDLLNVLCEEHASPFIEKKADRYKYNKCAQVLRPSRHSSCPQKRFSVRYRRSSLLVRFPIMFVLPLLTFIDNKGHETSSSALTWTLYALSRSPRIQHKLRQQLQDLAVSPSAVPSPEDIDLILSQPYLDACIRESLRLYAPVTSTMRVAAHDDFVPVSRPYTDTHGRLCDHIRLNEGDIITIPIQAMNKSRMVWGDDAHEFVPERFMKGQEKEGVEDEERGLKGLWGGILTFGSGHVVNGNRSCIGYRFAINE